ERVEHAEGRRTELQREPHRGARFLVGQRHRAGQQVLYRGFLARLGFEAGEQCLVNRLHCHLSLNKRIQHWVKRTRQIIPSALARGVTASSHLETLPSGSSQCVPASAPARNANWQSRSLPTLRRVCGVSGGMISTLPAR